MGRSSADFAPIVSRSYPVRVVRDPSYPDRARIDSDVRAFLRPPSSPWIVFDRDSRVDAGVDVRVLAEDGRSLPLVEADEAEGARAEVDPSAETGYAWADTAHGEPVSASVLVASAEAASAEALAIAAGATPAPPPAVPVVDDAVAPRAKRGLLVAAGIVAGFGGLGACLAFLVGFGGSLQRAPVSSAPAAIAPASPLVAPAAPAAPTPSAVAATGPSMAASALATSSAAGSASASTARASRFGKLTIRGDAKQQHVYLDGKRLLGSGTRSFTVYCGAHSVAIGDRGNARDVDVPCNGELPIGKLAR